LEDRAEHSGSHERQPARLEPGRAATGPDPAGDELQAADHAGESVDAPAATPPPKAPEKPKATPTRKAPPTPAEPTAMVSEGTALKITMNTPLSSETASLGQQWTGSIAEAVTVGNMAPFPAGSVVHGVVDGVKPAEKGDRAVLVLRVTRIEANGRTHD